MERESSLFPYQPKAPQEHSDEEKGKIELYLSALMVMPAERVRPERKSTDQVHVKVVQ